MKAVVGSVSKVAVERGVYTEDSLKERWAGAEAVARKVAAIGDDGGSFDERRHNFFVSLHQHTHR